MTAKSDSAKPPVEETTEDELDQQYEEEIKELVERLVRRNRPKPTHPKPRAKPEPDLESPAEPEAPEEAESEAPEEAEPEAAVKAESEEQPDRPGPRRVVTMVLAAVLAAALVTAAALAVLLIRSGGDSRVEITERAGYIASTIYNYDYEHVNAYQKAQASVLAPDTAAKVKQSWGTLSAFITNGRLVSVAKINKVYTADIHGNTASAIVDVDIRLTTAKGIATQTSAMVEFSLIRRHGSWLANDAPKLISPGTETDTDLQGNPLQPAASPSATPSK